jgi:hypothetical protein
MLYQTNPNLQIAPLSANEKTNPIPDRFLASDGHAVHVRQHFEGNPRARDVSRTLNVAGNRTLTGAAEGSL